MLFRSKQAHQPAAAANARPLPPQARACNQPAPTDEGRMPLRRSYPAPPTLYYTPSPWRTDPSSTCTCASVVYLPCSFRPARRPRPTPAARPRPSRRYQIAYPAQQDPQTIAESNMPALAASVPWGPLTLHLSSLLLCAPPSRPRPPLPHDQVQTLPFSPTLYHTSTVAESPCRATANTTTSVPHDRPMHGVKSLGNLGEGGLTLSRS